MATEKLTISVEKAVLQDIAAALGAEDAKKTAICENFALHAVLEWHAWLKGSRRYLSLTEQQIERVALLYEDLLPGERPSGPDISHRFNIPDGAAAYISRVLSGRKFTQWRQQGLVELKKAIQAKARDAAARVKANEGDKLTGLRLTKIAVRELERCLDESLKRNGALALPRRGATSGEQVELSVEWATIAALAEHPDLKKI
jgi:hypothetical protein